MKIRGLIFYVCIVGLTLTTIWRITVDSRPIPACPDNPQTINIPEGTACIMIETGGCVFTAPLINHGENEHKYLIQGNRLIEKLKEE